MRRLVNEAVARSRASRLFEAVRAFQRAPVAAIFKCSLCCKCLTDPRAFSILGDCGHTCCAECLARCKITETCQYSGCNGSVQSFRVINPSDLGQDDRALEEERDKNDGSKFAALIRLLKDTDRIGVDDQAILFIQFPEVMEAASTVLTDAHIPHLLISTNDRTAASKIGEFQAGTESVKSRVLILNLGDVTASGL